MEKRAIARCERPGQPCRESGWLRSATIFTGQDAFDIRHIIAGHCTGWRALHALANEYGDRVSQSAVGTTYRFQAGSATHVK